MISISNNRSALTMVALVAAMMIITVAEAQTMSTCASKLIACSDYLNSTTPPNTCCDPLREVITNELDCLCDLYESGILSTIGVNITQILRLPQFCNISGDLSACNVTGPAPGPSFSSMPPPPPAVPGNDGGKMAWSGMSSVILLLASMMLS